MDYKDAINNIGSLTSVNFAQSLAIIDATCERMKESQRLEELAKIDRQNAPILKELRSIMAETQEQNRILVEQNRLLAEENERQKEEVKIARQQEEKASREAKRSNRKFWLSTGVAMVTIVVSVILHFI